MKFLNGNSTLETKTAIMAAVKLIGTAAYTGHYLDRLIAVIDALQVLPQYRPLLVANRDFLRHNHKPAGLDALTLEVSEAVLHCCELAGLESHHLLPICWALDLEALKNAQMDYLRSI